MKVFGQLVDFYTLCRYTNISYRNDRGLCLRNQAMLCECISFFLWIKIAFKHFCLTEFITKFVFAAKHSEFSQIV